MRNLYLVLNADSNTSNGCRKQRAKPNRPTKSTKTRAIYIFLVRAWATGTEDQDDSQSPWEWHF